MMTINEIRAVSIHAPVWGATIAGKTIVIDDKVSIHAPVWGATLTHLAFTPP